MTSEQTPDVQATMKAINDSCREKGGHYAGYRCEVVSWDDVSRGTVGGLSCWGGNITDTYLKSRHGVPLFTLRSENWNERLGAVSAEQVAVVAAEGREPLRPVTLKKVLQELGLYGSYAGLATACNLHEPKADVQCSIRFQTTFLPVQTTEAPGKLEFATEAYNYNTLKDDDPRNLLLLCTSQGMAVQQDGSGAKKLFHHAVDDAGRIHRYWLEAEETCHKVGGEQLESATEKATALARGKATSSVIGIKAMGQRFNVLMTIQIPLQQQALPRPRMAAKACLPKATNLHIPKSAEKCRARSRSPRGRAKKKAKPPQRGQSSAARVSRGSEEDLWCGLSVTSPKRKGDEHVTITVVMYHAVSGGVPSVDDVTAAIDDLESLYKACSADGRRADSTFDFANKALKVDDLLCISEKVHFQPPPAEVVGFEVFPL